VCVRDRQRERAGFLGRVREGRENVKGDRVRREGGSPEREKETVRRYRSIMLTCGS
jgi:hypothetical protein